VGNSLNPLNIFGKLIYSHRLLKYDLFPMPSLLIHANAYVGFEPCEQFKPSQVKWVHTFNAGINNYLAIDGVKFAMLASRL
jgi:hypothetical protein